MRHYTSYAYDFLRVELNLFLIFDFVGKVLLR